MKPPAVVVLLEPWANEGAELRTARVQHVLDTWCGVHRAQPRFQHVDLANERYEPLTRRTSYMVVEYSRPITARERHLEIRLELAEAAAEISGGVRQ